jgi:hypothetical protein
MLIISGKDKILTANFAVYQADAFPCWIIACGAIFSPGNGIWKVSQQNWQDLLYMGVNLYSKTNTALTHLHAIIWILISEFEPILAKQRCMNS